MYRYLPGPFDIQKGPMAISQYILVEIFTFKHSPQDYGM